MSLEDARSALSRDLAGRHAEVVDRCVEDRRWWLEQWADGAPLLVCLVAQDVQEALHEQDPTWPLCPEHHDHSLAVEPDLGPDPFWVCDKTGLPVAAVGSLNGLPPD